MTVNALHNMVQDNYDRDELSSFFELTLYHTISWWIDVANDIPLDELPRNLYINKQGMDMYDYLNSVNSYSRFGFFTSRGNVFIIQKESEDIRGISTY